MLKKKVVKPSKKKTLISKKETIIDNKVNELQPESRVIFIHPGERISIVSESSTKTPNFNFDDF